MNRIFTFRNTLVLLFILVGHFGAKAQSDKKVILVVRPGDTTSTGSQSGDGTDPSSTRSYSAPTTAERTGAATYMLPGDAGKTKKQTPPPITRIDAPSGTSTTSGSNAPVKNYTPPAVADTKPAAEDTTATIKDISGGGATGSQIIFGEIGGPGLSLSANYDRRISGRRDGLGFRVGAGYYGTGGNTVFSVPIQLNYLYGTDKHFVELGIGTTFLNSTGDNRGKTFIFDRVTGFIGTATIGYRYQPEDSHLNFRIGFVPILYDEGIIAAGGLSVGYTF